MDALRWRIAAGSVRGTSHEKTGLPCQDAHFYVLRPDGVLVAAVADGAGTAARSEIGSSLASRTAVEFLCGREPGSTWPRDDEGWRALLTDALEAARTAVESEAPARGLPLRDLATTLIVMVATGEVIAAAQVGDGACVVGDSYGDLHPVTVPESGEYINETTFIVSPDAVANAQIRIWRGAVQHAAILSDGLQMLALKMPEGAPHAPFFSPLFRFVDSMQDQAGAEDQLAAFLRSPKITARADDDLTLLLATRT